MGRYLSSTSLSGTSGNGSGVASFTSTLTVTENVQQGDVLTQSADGSIWWGNDPSSGLTPLRPLYQTVQSYLAPVTALNKVVAPSTVGATWGTSFKLANGNIGHIYYVAASTSLYFEATGQDNTEVVAPVLLVNNVASINSMLPYTAMPLAGGGFCLTYFTTGANNYPQFGIFSNVGAVVAAVAQVGAIAPITSNPMELIQLSGGNIVWFLASKGFVIYNSATGAVVTGLTATWTGISNTPGVTQPTSTNYGGNTNICPAGNGGFVVLTLDTVAYDLKHNLFTSTGTLVNIQASASGITGGNNVIAACALLSNGNVIGVATNTTAGLLAGLVTSSAGAVISNFTGTPANGIATSIRIISTAGGAAVLAGGTASGTIVTFNSPAIGLSGTPVFNQVSGTPTFSTASTLTAALLLDGNIVFGWAGNATATNGLALVNSTGVPISGAVINNLLGGSIGSLALSITLPQTSVSGTPQQSAFSVFVPGNSVCQELGFIDFVPVTATLGVALANAAAGQSCPIQIAGGAQTRLTFKKPVQAGTPIGRLAIVGNQAIMTAGARNIN